MFDNKQLQNIRNALFKYVPSPDMRSRIVMLATTLSEDEATDAEKAKVYWSTIWFCAQPKNHKEFEKMYTAMASAGELSMNAESEGEGVVQKVEKRRMRTGNEQAK